MSSMRRAKNRTLEGFGAPEHGQWKESFYFIQGADTQLGLIENYGDGTPGDKYPNIKWDKEIELCKKSVEILNALEPKPAFFIVCGDLIDCMPDRFPEIRKRQEEDLKEIYSALDPTIPMICVCGNHDIGNTPTKETIKVYTDSFGDDYFSFWFGGVHFLVLNSQFYEDSSLVPDLAQAHEEWLDKQLQISKAQGVKHTVLFQHIPWFVSTPDEAKFYFNVEQRLRLKMLEKFYSAGIRKIFCGHYHRNAGGWYKDLEVVVTTAIGCQIGPDTHGMRIVRVEEDRIEHSFHALADFPSNVKV